MRKVEVVMSFTGRLTYLANEKLSKLLTLRTRFMPPAISCQPQKRGISSARTSARIGSSANHKFTIGSDDRAFRLSES